MTTNRVYVNVRETYDLSTKAGKLGFVGIHTPTTSSSAKGWSRQLQGLLRHFKYVKFKSCDITLACASPMSLDPLQVGSEAGFASPQDVFNPILYTAVSNEAMSTLMSRIYNIPSNSVGRVVGTFAESTQSILDAQHEGAWSVELADPLETYYGLLASDGFRKAMPQAGLQMTDLKPFVHLVAATQPLVSPSGSGLIQTAHYPDASDVTDTYVPQRVISGGTIQMPRQPTMLIDRYVTEEEILAGDPHQVYASLPPVWVGAIILPPAILQKLYYRMVVTWHLEFSEFRPWEDTGSIKSTATIGRETYYSDYAETSQAMTTTGSSVDVGDMSLDPIMTQVG